MSRRSTSSTAAIALCAATLACAAIIWQPHTVSAQAAPTPDTVAFYTQRVVPIFQANCYSCHGGLNHRGGLNIMTKAGLLKGGHDGSVLDINHPEQSLLIKLIRHEGPVDDPMPMPPKPHQKLSHPHHPPPKPHQKLSDADIATVTAWIKAGAPMPDDAGK